MIYLLRKLRTYSDTQFLIKKEKRKKMTKT